MRNVLRSTNEVAHYWANKVQGSGRAASMFFEDEWIYSYGRHFCIARILESGVVVMTTRGYSPTTAQHIAKVRSASRHLTTVYCYDPAASAAENMRHARAEVAADLVRSGKPRLRATTRDALRASALRLAIQANDYLHLLPSAERIGVEGIRTDDLEAVRAQLLEAEAAREKLNAERVRERAIAKAQQLDKWRTHEILETSGLWDLPPALRLSRDGSQIETTKGAVIPVADAYTLWPLIQRAITGARDWTPGAPVGHYRLTRIRSDGSLVVGCHDIAYAEIQRVAQALGLLQPETEGA